MLGSDWRWVVAAIILICAIIATMGFVFLSNKSLKTWLLLAGNWIALTEAATLLVLLSFYPASILSPYAIASPGYLGPSGVTSLFQMIHFGAKLFWGDLILAVLTMAGIFALYGGKRNDVST